MGLPPTHAIPTAALVVVAAGTGVEGWQRRTTRITTPAAIFPTREPEGGDSEGMVRFTPISSEGASTAVVVVGGVLTMEGTPIGTFTGGTKGGRRNSWGAKTWLLGYRRGCPCYLPPGNPSVATWTNSTTLPLPPGTCRKWRSGRGRSRPRWLPRGRDRVIRKTYQWNRALAVCRVMDMSRVQAYRDIQAAQTPR